MQSKFNCSTRKYRLMVFDGQTKHILCEGNSAAIFDALQAAEIVANLPPRGSPAPVGPARDNDSGPRESKAPSGVPGDTPATEIRPMLSDAKRPGDLVQFPDGTEAVCIGRGRGDAEWANYRNRVRKFAQLGSGSPIHQELPNALLADSGRGNEGPGHCGGNSAE